ncbi:carboxymuconolactone decarboxylase family protein [Streptomyces sp. TRM70308]|uniref:carboxymuconolactone decarboxylase family protein n=1 Tax=Streptomyces sp. TRM70308 TaxID=3131932 RepID=UPI003D086E7C
MARVSLTPRRTLVVRLVEAFSRRRFGTVLDPLAATAHHPGVLRGVGLFELSVARWRTLDPVLKHLAIMAAACRIGCSWCVDFGHWEAHHLGLDREKVRLVPVWRDHPDVFTELERQVLAYAEAMTETQPSVTDEMTRPLVARLGEKAFVELTAMVAVENQRSRVNAALGLTGQGFAERCEVPPPGAGARG